MNAPHPARTAHPPLSRRAESLGTENAFVVLAEVNALVRGGADVVSFCIGQPDFPTPEHVQEAAIAAIRAGRHGYTPSAGIDELRAAAARDMGSRRGLDIAQTIGNGKAVVRIGDRIFRIAAVNLIACESCCQTKIFSFTCTEFTLSACAL